MKLYSVPGNLGDWFLYRVNDEDDLYELLKEDDLEQYFDQRELIDLDDESERGCLVHILDCDW